MTGADETPRELSKPQRRELFRLAGTEFFYVMTYATYTYLTVYLMEIGYGSDQIGTMLAVGSFLAMISLPVMGYVSDRLGSSKGIFILCVAVSGVSGIAIFTLNEQSVANGLFPAIVIIALLYMMRAPTMSLLDIWVVKRIAPYDLSYGPFRLCGSLGYALLSLVLSFVFADRSVRAIFLINAVIVLALIAFAASVPAADIGEKRAKNKVRLSELFANGPFKRYLVLLAGLHIYSAIALTYMAYIVVHAGLSQNTVGLVLGFRAVPEMVALGLAGKLAKRITMKRALVIAAFVAVAEHLLYGQVAGLPALLAVMVLSGIEGGIFFSVGPQYMFSIVPKTMSNTAQTLGGLISSVICIVGSYAGGMVIKAYGIQVLTNISAAVILASVILFLVLSRLNKQEGK